MPDPVEVTENLLPPRPKHVWSIRTRLQGGRDGGDGGGTERRLRRNRRYIGRHDRRVGHPY
jgi:hypothetical protein